MRRKWRRRANRWNSRQRRLGNNLELVTAVKNILRKPLIIVSFWIALLVGCSVVIPGILVEKQTMTLENDPLRNADRVEEREGTMIHTEETPIVVPVYMNEQKQIEELPLEMYVRGVVAAEMPAEFDIEALKAQAIAARTYIVRRIAEQDFSHVPVEGAWVTDTVQHQAFLTVDKMRERWGWFSFTSNWRKLTQAVEETKGIVMTYDGRPIEASYFSTSNGNTENSEDYWNLKTPYLRSVQSPWDIEISPKYKQVKTYKPSDFAHLLGITTAEVTNRGSEFFRITERTEGNRVKEVVVGNQTFTGREVREKLELASSHFEVQFSDGKIHVTTYGYGHGVGMSQYGAQGMALEGHYAEEILKHYYQGIKLEPISNLAKSVANLAKVIEEQV